MESVFLFCFAFGALFAFISAGLSAVGAGFDHIGHFGGHVGGHVDVGALDAAHGSGPLDIAHVQAHAPHAWVGLLSPTAVLAFLTCFGGMGYVAMHFWGWPAPLATLPAVGIGAVVGGLIGKMLLALRQDMGTMNSGDYQVEGTVARVTVSIPTDGVGEILFTLGGVRRSEGARAASGQAIARDTEVIVTAFKSGLAMVQPASEFVAKLAQSESAPLSRNPAPAELEGQHAPERLAE